MARFISPKHADARGRMNPYEQVYEAAGAGGAHSLRPPKSITQLLFTPSCFDSCYMSCQRLHCSALFHLSPIDNVTYAFNRRGNSLFPSPQPCLQPCEPPYSSCRDTIHLACSHVHPISISP
mmetsp:Transcript_21772/g.66092  ORF Transcript_21772/g.66092 Transcript_21772/m.66092 type:complete len:122 (+) Transcript_21772:1426-1791(+)